MIYLDSAAHSQPITTEVDYAIQANASSRSHFPGIEMKRRVEASRARLAEHFQIPVNCLVFTSGATESISILSTHLPFTSASPTSHSAMLDALEDSKYVGSQAASQMKTHHVRTHFGFEHVNNETGIVNTKFSSLPLDAHVSVDLTQSIFKVDIALPRWDFMVGSAHKFHGPLGVGFLASKDVDGLELLIDRRRTHRQELGIRPGTLNAPAIIQTGEVAKWMLKNGDEYRAKLKHLQSTFENKIKSLTDCWIIGADQERAPHITSLNLPGVDNEALIAAVNDRLAIASGSACTSEKVEPSHVLMAMFNDREIADTTVRISYGWFNTEAEVLEAAEIIAKAAETIRSFSL